MENKKDTAKHSVGKGAQKEKYNSGNEASYVKDSKENIDNPKNQENYLEMKWKKISSDFRKKYNMEVSESEYKGNSFSEILKKLEKKTGKSMATLEQEIKDWQNS
ncbi:MAG: hypothetical protein V7655_11435 [Aequorivita antarctica]